MAEKQPTMAEKQPTVRQADETERRGSVTDVETPIDALLTPGSENYFPEAEAIFERYGESISQRLNEIEQDATTNPDDYPPPPKKDASDWGAGANLLRDIVASAIPSSSKGNAGKAPRLTPLDHHSQPETIAEWARRVVRAYPDPAELIAHYDTVFAKKSAVAQQIGIDDYREPEQTRHVLDKLIPVIYGDRYEAYLSQQNYLKKAAKAEALQATRQEAENQAATLGAGEVLTNHRSVRIKIHTHAAEHISSIQHAITSLQNTVSYPKYHILKVLKEDAELTWQKKQARADKAIFFKKWRAGRAAKARNKFDTRNKRFLAQENKMQSRTTRANTSEARRQQAVDAYQTAANEREIIKARHDTAKMNKYARTVEKRYLKHNSYRNLSPQEQLDALAAFRESPVFAQAIRALIVTELRKKAKKSSIYRPPR